MTVADYEVLHGIMVRLLSNDVGAFDIESHASLETFGFGDKEIRILSIDCELELSETEAALLRGMLPVKSGFDLG